jgi:hypothetical protein
MLDEGGLVVGSVMHASYHLAKDIRVVRVWVNEDDPDPKLRKNLRLGKRDFEVLTSDPSYLKYAPFNAPPPFHVYTKDGPKEPAGVQAVYRTRAKLFGQPGDPDDKDPDDDYLTITQSFIFTKYGKDPAHEPGGVLPAARVFPLIKFSYGGKKVKSIRFDYRLHVSLDILLGRDSALDPQLDTGLLKKLKAGGEEGLKKIVGQLSRMRPMLAGIFRDTDELPPGTDTEDIFFAVEKPVLREVVGYGLKRGIPGEKVSERTETPRAHEASAAAIYEIAPGDASTWDNIHMWSNRRLIGNEYVKKHPSTFGAFHAFHCHWRWPHYAAHPSLSDHVMSTLGGAFKKLGIFTSNSFGEEQFKGLPMKGHFEGPLLDPRIPTQTIQFAVTLSKPPANTDPRDRWDADQCPSERVFEDLFIKPDAPSLPRDISLGEDILTWLSFKVYNDGAAAKEGEKFQGTVFMHGLFFAHNAEMTWIQSPFAGTIGQELQKPKYPQPTWRRSPNGK